MVVVRGVRLTVACVANGRADPDSEQTGLEVIRRALYRQRSLVGKSSCCLPNYNRPYQLPNPTTTRTKDQWFVSIVFGRWPKQVECAEKKRGGDENKQINKKNCYSIAST